VALTQVGLVGENSVARLVAIGRVSSNTERFCAQRAVCIGLFGLLTAQRSDRAGTTTATNQRQKTNGDTP
jgi:hypothetical protein